jgi:hypothetical protein
VKGFLAGATLALSIAKQINHYVLSDTRLGSDVRKNVMKHLSYDVLVLIRKEIETELTRRLR